MAKFDHIKLDEGEVLVPENVTPDMPPIPVEDRHGRPRWISSRECYCSDDAPTDCRFHSSTEPGWETCPSKPRSRHELERAVPRKLYHTNPEFGKPLVKEDPVEDSENAN